MLLCDSKPNSWYRFSWEVPLVAPVMARDALCCVELTYLTTERFILWLIINHITIAEMGPYKRTVEKRGRMLLSSQIITILLLALFIFSLI